MQVEDKIPIVITRPARSADAAAIARVHVETWRDAYAGLLPDKHLLRLDARSHAIAWARNLTHTDGPRHTMVAVADDTVVGFVNFGAARGGRPSDEGEVFMLYVATDWRDQGIGRHLVDGAFAELTARGFATASIWCLAENAAAIGFYKRLGGQRIPQSRQENVGGTLFPVIGFGWQLRPD